MPSSGSRTEQFSPLRSARLTPGSRRIEAFLANDRAQAIVGVLDQGIAALTAAIPVVVLGRLAGAHELGLYSLAVSAALFVTITIQSLFLSGYPFFRAQDRASADLQTFHIVFFGFGAQAVVAPLVLCGLLVFPHAGVSLPLGLTTAAFVTTTVLRAYLRTLSLVRRDLLAILVLDSIGVVLLATLLAAMVARGTIGVVDFSIVFSITNALFIVAWCCCYADRLRPSLSGAYRYLIRSARFGRWAFAGVTCGSMPYYLTPWILTLAQGSEMTGIYAAGSTIAGLVNHAMLGLLRGVEARTAEAFRHSPAQLRRALVQTFRIVLPALLALVAAVFLLADFAGAIVLPGRAAEAGAVARLLSLALVVGSVRVILGNGLWAMGLPQATLGADLFRGVASIGLAIVGAYYAGALGCAAAVLVGDIGSTFLLVRRYRTESPAGSLAAT
jgi:O-antigen/teichoic acid export membrane protein